LAFVKRREASGLGDSSCEVSYLSGSNLL
jgi:hypothetical protein